MAAPRRDRGAIGAFAGRGGHRRGADHLLAGHAFPTASHSGVPTLGLAGLARIVAASPCPVLAMGGIDAGNAADAVAAGAVGVAVVGSVAHAVDPDGAVWRLRAAFDRALEERATMATTDQDRMGRAAAPELALTVNGRPAAVPGGWTVRDFLASKGLAEGMAIVERNGGILPRAAYGTVLLADGDRLEVVHAVGGG